MNVIISNKNQDYAGFIANAMDEFEKHKIHGIAIVALCDDINLTGYYNMSLHDKMIAKNEIEFDTIDVFILNNKDRYFDEDN